MENAIERFFEDHGKSESLGRLLSNLKCPVESIEYRMSIRFLETSGYEDLITEEGVRELINELTRRGHASHL